MEMDREFLKEEDKGRQDFFDHFLNIMAAGVFTSVGISFLLWLVL